MKVLTVSELTHAIKGCLEPTFSHLQIQGEISNLKFQSSGHLYFSLKDAASQVSAVLFRGDASLLPHRPKEGDQVIAKGQLSVYAPRGQYQLIVRELSFLGVGELLLKFHALKELLAKRGWFDPGHKKALPHLPKRIGVVTSPTGAVIQDILHVLTRRFSGCEVILNPVKVQGEGAKEEIARAIAEFNQYNLADVLIVGRGGGSIEDLWAFNEEGVAQAIFSSKIPIISAVGHETDYTIADWVADVRAPTPSAAAEIVIQEKAALLKSLQNFENTLFHRLFSLVEKRREKLTLIEKHPLFSSPYALLAEPMQKIDTYRMRIEENLKRTLEEKKKATWLLSKQYAQLKPSQKLKELSEKLKSMQKSIDQALTETLQRKQEELRRLFEHLLSINPKNLLKKGYALLFSQKEGSLILSAKTLTPKMQLFALLQDGKARLSVDSVEEP